MTSFLDNILKHKEEALADKKLSLPLRELRSKLKDVKHHHSSFKEAIKRKKGKGLSLIAEIKKASPSEGLIRRDFNPREIASIYDKKKVDAISVLTEEKYFSGSLLYLEMVKHTTEIPVLRKDFIFDDYQLYESLLYGADALLLITSILDRDRLKYLILLAKELGLDCLIEIHNIKELEDALYAGADIIGINNRDLTTFKVDLNRTFELLPNIPEDVVLVSESGIKNREDIERLKSSKVDAVLIGTAIMKSPNIGTKIDELRAL
ncbi:MAG: indole-3-glycerol phosphate synthase TrpC [Nitrospirae bacterium]|nr:MAG: indole-3-glycerol phosphate synthase TrpC [Nitrospirota bacterium]